MSIIADDRQTTGTGVCRLTEFEGAPPNEFVAFVGFIGNEETFDGYHMHSSAQQLTGGDTMMLGVQRQGAGNPKIYCWSREDGQSNTSVLSGDGFSGVSGTPAFDFAYFANDGETIHTINGTEENTGAHDTNGNPDYALSSRVTAVELGRGASYCSLSRWCVLGLGGTPELNPTNLGVNPTAQDLIDFRNGVHPIKIWGTNKANPPYVHSMFEGSSNDARLNLNHTGRPIAFSSGDAFEWDSLNPSGLEYPNAVDSTNTMNIAYAGNIASRVQAPASSHGTWVGMVEDDVHYLISEDGTDADAADPQFDSSKQICSADGQYLYIPEGWWLSVYLNGAGNGLLSVAASVA